MAEVRTIPIPPWFNSIVASAGEESLRGLSQRVRKDLDAGKTPNEVIDGLAEAGWDKAFLEWYVFQVAAASEELILQAGFAAYPRGSTRQFKESADDILAVVEAYRRTNRAFLVWLVGIVAWLTLSQFTTWHSVLAAYVLQLLCQLAAVAITIGAWWQVTRPMRWGRTVVVVFAIALTLVPCGGFLFLASCSSRFHDYLRKAGVRIGFLGPDPDSVRKAILARTNVAIPTIGPDYMQR
ncbi:MAG TPA: hypothetical protein VHE55_16920 [Fimbriimonadaceae bacterium]|nr:hypothetical protein [Fimbriimonadaceae bacterium]